MGSKPERHHLVSRGYLKGWLPDGETQRVRVRLLPSREPKLIGVNDICVKPWWLAVRDSAGNRDVTLETQLGKIETRAIPRLRQTLATGFVPAQSRINFAYYLSSLAARGPRIREDMKRWGVEVGEEYLNDHPDAEVPVRAEQNRHLTGEPALLLIFDLVVPMHAAWLTSMHWAFYRDPRAGFATSDQPVLHLCVDADAPVTSPTPLYRGNLDAIMVALSPSVLFVATWRPGPDAAPQTAPIGLPAWFNQQVHDQAYRHFVEPPEVPVRMNKRVALPELDLRRDTRRFVVAAQARQDTLDLRDPAGMVYVRYVNNEYRTFTTVAPTAGGELPPAAAGVGS
jgi:hypothetical protein